MKTTDPRDPLDKKIDQLLVSRPLKPKSDFAARVIAAADAEDAAVARFQQPTLQARLLRYALPLAAIIVVALTIPAWINSDPKITETALNTAEAQEIFLLEENLHGLAQFDDSLIQGENLLLTFEALYYDTQS